MDKRRKAIKITTYVAGILAVASAVLVAILLTMSALGIIFPRKQTLILRTDDVVMTYSSEPVYGGMPVISYDSLLPGHRLEVTEECRYTNVGEYENVPEFVILDSVGADVTDMYQIHTKFGKIKIEPRHLTVYSQSKEKRYDGEPLVSDEIVAAGGSFAEGHTLVCESTTSITLPGEQKIMPSYIVTDKNGADVTDQYKITEKLGTLTVLPLSVTITTESAQKQYDGTALSADGWQHTAGELLEGHTVKAVCITKEIEVGVYENRADVRIYDQNGTDVTQLYEIVLIPGLLTVDPLVLHISTGSAEKEYDGTFLTNHEWEITSGSLAKGENIEAVSFPQRKKAGESKNEIVFKITDTNGNIVTDRYKIILSAGTLTVTPRAITIQTGSATKKYDGTALLCREYEITKGSLCAGDTLELSFTSIVNIGYTENYIIDHTIYGEVAGGNKTDVTLNYKITFDYGTLTVTAD